MKVGVLVVRKSYDKDITFKIIDIKEDDKGNEIYILKGISIRIIADSREDDLEKADDEYAGTKEKILNRRVEEAIKKAVSMRGDEEATKVLNNLYRGSKTSKNQQNKELIFGRPGKILHIDGDSEYLETCLKVYKQLSLDAVGRAVTEKKQPEIIVDLVKEIKPDIVVLTGHDSVLRTPDDY